MTDVPLRPLRSWLFAASLSLATLVFTAAPATAQFGGPGGGRVSNAFEVGGRAGYDFQADAPVLGAYARTSVFWRLALQGSGDLTFLDGLTDRQASGELLVRVQPGFWVGGGVAFRNSIYDRTLEASSDDRETRTGYTIVGLLGGSGTGRWGTGIELRYTSVDDFDSQTVALQVGIPLARW